MRKPIVGLHGMFGGMTQRQILHFIDKDSRMRAELSRAAYGLGHHAEVYASFDELLERPPSDGIIIARDEHAEGGIARDLFRLIQAGIWLPAIAIAEKPDAELVVRAIKAGALDYLELPVAPNTLANTLERVADEAEEVAAARQRIIEARERVGKLSRRESQVLDLLVTGLSNKEIARELEISPRTVEIHRANMMLKLGVKHAAEAVRLALEARQSPAAAMPEQSAIPLGNGSDQAATPELGGSEPERAEPLIIRS